MKEQEWPFADPKNVAVFTVAEIMDGKSPILVVCHDDDDGGWQFLTGRPLPNQTEWRLVALEEIAILDPSVKELWDLPFGWIAKRGAADQRWVAARHPGNNPKDST